MLFVSHDRHFLAALSNRVLELTPEGVHVVRRRLHRVRRAHAATRRPACGAEPVAAPRRSAPSRFDQGV